MSGQPEPAAPARRAWARPRVAEAIVTGLFTLYVAWPFVRGDGYVTSFDTLTYSGPLTTTTFDALGDGRLAQWNPQLFGGTIQLANPQAAVLYPLKAAVSWLPPQRAIDVLDAVHLFVLAFGALALLAWRLRLRPPAAALGAVIVVGSGAIGARQIQLEQMAVIAWIPWVMLGVDWLLDEERPPGRAVAATAVATALLLVAGHPQQVVIATPVLVTWIVARALDRRAPRRLLAVAAGGLLGVLLAAAQLVPTALALDESENVGARTVEAAASPNLSAKADDLPGTLLGSIFLDRPDLTSDAFEAMGYVGAAALLLAAVGAGAGLGERDRRWTTAAMVLQIAMGMVLALGPQCAKTPTEELVDCHTGGGLYRTLYRHVPGLNSERAPGRWMLVVVLGLALLAASGLDVALRRRLRADALAVSAALGGLLVGVLWVLGDGLPPETTTSTLVAWLSFAAITAGAVALIARPPARRRATGLALGAAVVIVGLVVVELGLPAADSIPRQVAGTASFESLAQPATTWLAEDGGRVLTLVEEKFDDYRYLVGGMRPNANGLYDVRSIDGYDGGMMVTKAWALAMSAAVDGQFQPEKPLRWQIRVPVDTDLLSRWGVRYVLVGDNDRKNVLAFDEVVFADDLLEVRENPDFHGEAFVVHRSRAVGPTELAVQLTHLPLDTVLVPAGADELSCTGSCDPEPAEVERIDPEHLRVTVDAEAAGLLVVTEQHQPGWEARVDGEVVPTVAVDGMNIGVPIDAGPHTVELRYRAPGLRLGLALSALALLATVLFAAGLADRAGRALLDRRARS